MTYKESTLKSQTMFMTVVGSKTKSFFEDKLFRTEISIVASSFVGIAMLAYRR